jgi:hypothetical protein
MSEQIQLPHLRPEIDSLLESATDTATLYEVVKRDPLCLEAWARLSDMTYEAGDDVASYAFARTGYHRGLDLLRSTGWRPDLQVGWSAETNRGFLRSLFGLMRGAAAIGEGVEARRCREFLLQLDPSDPLDVRGIAPRDLSRRLPD